MDVVVIGAGAGGLAAALWLDDAGHRVVVVERDTWRPPDDPAEAIASWARRGIPQGPHPHNFMAAARNVLRERSPDVLSSMLDAGAHEVPIGRNLPGADGIDERRRAELTALATRRQLFDWALFRAVEQRLGERLITGEAVTAVEVQPGAPPVVAGVVAGGRSLRADLVVDAGGRRSPLPGLLREQGVELVEVGDEPCGIVYLTQYHRLRPGAARGPMIFGFMAAGDLPFCRGALFGGDGDTFATIVGVDPEDGELRRAASASDAAYRVALQALPMVGDWFADDRTEPITSVAPMAGLRNALRSAMSDGRPVVAGYVPTGDSWCTTNPMFGWGASLAMLHAAVVTDLVDGGARGEELVAALDAHAMPELQARWRTSVLTDAERIGRWRGLPPPEGADGERAVQLRALVGAMRSDPLVAERMMRRANLLDPVDDVLADPEVIRRAEAAAAAAPAPPTEPVVREELLARLAEAAP